MTVARKELVDLSTTRYYHCMARCVRRAYLCGEDFSTGRNFDHRKSWIVSRLKELASVFAVDVCAYAVMSNHYHLVLHVNVDKAGMFTNEEIVSRWAKLFPTDAKSVSLNNKKLSAAEKELQQNKIAQWRERLTDISWFMRCMNECIARQANREDKCTGRFWEGRFKCQALLDDAALLTCMAYVDLNPVRAGLACKPEEAEFTSIYERALAKYKKKIIKTKKGEKQQLTYVSPEGLASFKQNGSSATEPPISFNIPYSFKDYLRLLQDTSECLNDAKPPDITHQILTSHRIDQAFWIESMAKFTRSAFQFIGQPESLSKVRKDKAILKLKGSKFCSHLFNSIAA